jgi:hypothetical protein
MVFRLLCVHAQLQYHRTDTKLLTERAGLYGMYTVSEHECTLIFTFFTGYI